MTEGGSQHQVRELAVLVVYYVRSDDDLALVRLHLDRIRRHTSVPYTIYAAAQRVSPAVRSVLDGDPHVRVVDLPSVSLRGSKEHGHYLDALLAAALEGSATHIATLDVDSFPIVNGWYDQLFVDRANTVRMVGILRRENGDTDLAHPSCIVATRELFEELHPSFEPFTGDDRGRRAHQQATGQAADTGIDVTVQLWRNHEPWGHALRSNVCNPHPIMAGIYGDAVFHLGGIGHGKVFRSDRAGSRAHRWSRPLERIPVGSGRLRTVKLGLLRKVRSRSELRMAEHNRAVYRELRDWLLDDSDSLIAYLQGHPQPDARARVAALSAVAHHHSEEHDG